MEKCKYCDGYGWTVDAGCCNNPTPNGNCCGNAIQVQEQCEYCRGTGDNLENELNQPPINHKQD